MSKDIDLRPGENDYRVSTSVKRGNDHYMGPDVIVRARDAEHAADVARKNGHTPSRHFPPTKIRRG